MTLPTNCLSQSDDHFLAGGDLCDPTDHALNSIDPHLQLHPGSISGGSGAAGLWRHTVLLQGSSATAVTPLTATLQQPQHGLGNTWEWYILLSAFCTYSHTTKCGRLKWIRSCVFECLLFKFVFVSQRHLVDWSSEGFFFFVDTFCLFVLSWMFTSGYKVAFVVRKPLKELLYIHF